MTIALQRSQYESKMNYIELEKISKIADHLAKCDPLTNLANRRFAYDFFEKEFKNESIPHCIVMADIDNFKQINDSYGHEFGDEVLVTIANYMEEVLPKIYLKSRWGGEEFLLAANASLKEVYPKIESLRKIIEKHPFMYLNQKIEITLTFGMSEYYEKKDLSAAILKADQRLYDGKKKSKNCIITN